MQIGDNVLVPRTGGGESAGEVIEIYEGYAQVKFISGETFRGEPNLPENQQRTAYKKVSLTKLKAIPE